MAPPPMPPPPVPVGAKEGVALPPAPVARPGSAIAGASAPVPLGAEVIRGRRRFPRKFRSRAVVSPGANRYVRAEVWLTPEEKEQLQLVAFGSGLSESSYGRALILSDLKKKQAMIDQARQLRGNLQDSA